jgi:hypothetical protein
MRRALPSLCLAAVLLAACGGAAAEPSPAGSGPSGALGVMTAEAGTEMIAALCDLRTAADRDAANATFFDRAHQALHVLAAATETVDRVPAAGLLEAKQVVEADLQADALPPRFRADVQALLGAARAALETVQLPAPGC